jgi:hypothetical protein
MMTAARKKTLERWFAKLANWATYDIVRECSTSISMELTSSCNGSHLRTLGLVRKWWDGVVFGTTRVVQSWKLS